MAYRDDGRTTFCTTCQVSFVNDDRSIRDHERQNPYRHPAAKKETQ